MAFLIYNANSISAQTRASQTRLIGCEAIPCGQLKKRFNLNRKLPYRRSRAKNLRKNINRFYFRKGYTLARVFIVRNTPAKVVLFIDEGVFRKVIFQNANPVDLIRLRTSFSLKPNVFHARKLKKEVSRIRRRFNYKAARYEVRKTKDHSPISVQIDRTISNLFGSDDDLKGFNIPPPQHDLVIMIEKKPKTRTKGLYMGARFKTRKGFIPYVDHRTRSLFNPDDELLVEFAMGAVYVLDGEFNSPPRSSIFRFLVDYDTRILESKRIGFSLKNYFQRELNIRKDVGLKRYYETRTINQILLKLELVKNFDFYVGYGLGTVFLSSPTFTDENVREKLPLNFFVGDDGKFLSGSREFFQMFKFGFLTSPPDTGKFKKLDFRFGYTSYLRENSFNTLYILASTDYYIKSYSFFSFAVEGFYLFTSLSQNEKLNSILFYYDHRIANLYFKGFVRRDTHTKKILKGASQYRISVYKEYLFLGLYLDIAVFEGTKYELDKLSGVYFGIAGGGVIQILFVDQLNVDFYIGQDYLFRDDSSGFVLYIKAFLQF